MNNVEKPDCRFIINEHGVCINPERITLFQNNHSFAAIELAESSGQWSYAIKLEFYDYGISAKPSFSMNYKKYNCREEAKQTALGSFDSVFSYIKKAYKEKGSEDFVSILREIIDEHRQLELFT